MITTSSSAADDRPGRYGPGNYTHPALTMGGPKNGVRSEARHPCGEHGFHDGPNLPTTEALTVSWDTPFAKDI